MSPAREFYIAHRLWAERVRSTRTLTWQQGRVAWALGEFFSSSHGIAYARFEVIGERAGGVDRRDVSRAISALLTLKCIDEVAHIKVAVAAAADGIEEIGGRLRGFRMVLDTGELVAEWVAALVAFAPPDCGSMRVRRERTKGGTVPPFSKGGAVSPLATHSNGGHNEGLSGAEVVSIGGSCAPQIDRTDMTEEDARPARASNPSVHILRSVEATAPSIWKAARAPKGAVLTDDHRDLAFICFPHLSDEDVSTLAALVGRIGKQRFETELVNLGQRQLSGQTKPTVLEWVEFVGARASAHP